MKPRSSDGGVEIIPHPRNDRSVYVLPNELDNWNRLSFVSARKVIFV